MNSSLYNVKIHFKLILGANVDDIFCFVSDLICQLIFFSGFIDAHLFNS